jgi:hypothetical protein
MTMIPCNRTGKQKLPFLPFLVSVAMPTLNPQHSLKILANSTQRPAHSRCPPTQMRDFTFSDMSLRISTGTPMPDLFQEVLVDPLGLNGTSYTVPPSEDNSIIPFNTTISVWKDDLLDESPAGCYFTTINDMRAVGKAILNYTMVSPAQTRRWMKPDAFTGNPNVAVGAPWEIYRAPGDFASWMYIKAGAVGLYSSMFLLMPDLGFGFTILTAGENSGSQINTLTLLVARNFVSAFWNETAAQTESIYAGTYADAASNSSITVATVPDAPRLLVSEMTLGGQHVRNLLGSLMGGNVTLRLYPMGLEAIATNGTTEVSWRAIFESEDSSNGLAST